MRFQLYKKVPTGTMHITSCEATSLDEAIEKFMADRNEYQSKREFLQRYDVTTKVHRTLEEFGEYLNELFEEPKRRVKPEPLVHAQKPLDDIRSISYDANIERYGDYPDTCLICGKRVKDISKSLSVHLLTNGHIVASDDQTIEGSQGFFSIGSDCASRAGRGFTFKNR